MLRDIPFWMILADWIVVMVVTFEGKTFTKTFLFPNLLGKLSLYCTQLATWYDTETSVILVIWHKKFYPGMWSVIRSCLLCATLMFRSKTSFALLHCLCQEREDKNNGNFFCTLHHISKKQTSQIHDTTYTIHIKTSYVSSLAISPSPPIINQLGFPSFPLFSTIFTWSGWFFVAFWICQVLIKSPAAYMYMYYISNLPNSASTPT